MTINKKNLKKIKGDASFRTFYRKKNKDRNTIIVYAKKEKLKNLLIYDAINRLLIKNKILAPKLYSHNYSNDFIEIEDFGKETVFRVLNKNVKNHFKYYKKAIYLLNKIQSIKSKKIKNFKNKIYKIPLYKSDILFKEANLFCDWYARNELKKKDFLVFKSLFKKQIKFLLLNLKLNNDVFVHRDFHVSNMMKYKNKIALIDTQDALIGNKAYDLASLIDDVRIKTSHNQKKKIYDFFIKTNSRKLDNYDFKNDFEILSILRNLKIIGIFTRLAMRDKKRKYLKLIPYGWELINYRINNNELFKDLIYILKKYFLKKIKI